MELRLAAEHYGQKVTVYTEKNGKDTTIIPTNKRTQDEVELVYVPPTDRELVGHYDVMIRGVRTRVQADKSNCRPMHTLQTYDPTYPRPATNGSYKIKGDSSF